MGIIGEKMNVIYKEAHELGVREYGRAALREWKLEVSSQNWSDRHDWCRRKGGLWHAVAEICNFFWAIQAYRADRQTIRKIAWIDVIQAGELRERFTNVPEAVPSEEV